jgi:hypothetical protein
MLGMSKTFVIVLIIASIIGYGTKDWNNFFIILLFYIIIKIIWNLLT